MRGLFLAISLVSFSLAQNLYPIAEPDLLSEIESRKALVEEKLKRELSKDIRPKAPEGWEVPLELAQRSETYQVSMQARLDVDIPRVDNQGRIVGTLYPKGYTYNPLQYLPADPPVLIVFDYTDRRQRRYVKEKLFKLYPYRMLLISRGDYVQALEFFRERVYYLHPEIRKKFSIRRGISVVKWDRKRGMAIVEVIGCDKVGCRNSTEP